MKRNTSFRLSTTSKIHLYRAVISPTLLFASECWDFNRSEYKLVENFNGKVIRWLVGGRDYEEAFPLCSLLPLLYMKLLKELLLYNNIYLGIYDMDISEFAAGKWNGRRTRVNLQI